MLIFDIDRVGSCDPDVDSEPARDSGLGSARDRVREAGRESWRDTGCEVCREAGLDAGLDIGRDDVWESGLDIGRDDGRDLGLLFTSGLEVGWKKGLESNRESDLNWCITLGMKVCAGCACDGLELLGVTASGCGGPLVSLIQS